MESSAAHMGDLQVTRVRFILRALEMIGFGAQPGAQLRGGIYGALARQFCPDTGMRHLPGHSSACPVCWLLAREDPTAARGRDLPRPLAIQPPAAEITCLAGENVSFAISLIGERAAASLPFLVRAVSELGKEGVGHGRGRFEMKSIEELPPLSTEASPLLNGGRLSMPTRALDATGVDRHAADVNSGTATLRLITPLRIGEKERLMRSPQPGILIRRLLERCQALASEYAIGSSSSGQWRALSLHLSALADGLQVSADHSRWLDVQSGSRRSGVATPIGGLVGSFTIEGDLWPLLPWLLWGQIVQVGKSTVKGNGWYEVV